MYRSQPDRFPTMRTLRFDESAQVMASSGIHSILLRTRGFGHSGRGGDIILEDDRSVINDLRKKRIKRRNYSNDLTPTKRILWPWMANDGSWWHPADDFLAAELAVGKSSGMPRQPPGWKNVPLRRLADPAFKGRICPRSRPGPLCGCVADAARGPSAGCLGDHWGRVRVSTIPLGRGCSSSESRNNKIIRLENQA